MDESDADDRLRVWIWFPGGFFQRPTTGAATTTIILDVNDFTPEVSLSANAEVAVEGEAVEFTVTRTGGTSDTLLVVFTIDEPNHPNPGEHEPTSNSTRQIIIPAGSSGATFSVTPHNDGQDDGDVNDVLLIEIVEQPYYRLGETTRITLEIDDSLLPELSLFTDGDRRHRGRAGGVHRDPHRGHGR